jgi:hypothetical protein
MIDHNDWREIQNFVSRLLGEQGEPFTQGVVVKNDVVNKLVWLKEFGDQPIPLIAFDYQVKYKFQNSVGLTYENPIGQTVIEKTQPYTKDVEILTPRVGDMVLVARHLGSRRLPKCLGVVKSENYAREG